MKWYDIAWILTASALLLCWTFWWGPGEYDKGRADQAAADSAQIQPIPSRYVFLPPYSAHTHIEVFCDSVTVRFPDNTRNAYAFCDTIICRHVMVDRKGRVICAPEGK